MSPPEVSCPEFSNEPALRDMWGSAEEQRLDAKVIPANGPRSVSDVRSE